jgi:TolB-like protein
MIGGAWWLSNANQPAAISTKAPAAAASSAAGAPEAKHLSIVVLPFANLSSDPTQDYFADGVTENLTTDLSRLRGSIVIARNTAFSFKGKNVDAREIGKELGVRYVLEGSVQRDAGRIRVNVQLIDAETGNHLWADRFDKPAADLFEMQDEIVARVANQLGAELIAAEARRAQQAPNPDSTDLYFQGLRGSTGALTPKIWRRRAAILSALWRSIPTISMRCSVSGGSTIRWAEPTSQTILTRASRRPKGR